MSSSDLYALNIAAQDYLLASAVLFLVLAPILLWLSLKRWLVLVWLNVLIVALYLGEFACYRGELANTPENLPLPSYCRDGDALHPILLRIFEFGEVALPVVAVLFLAQRFRQSKSDTVTDLKD